MAISRLTIDLAANIAQFETDMGRAAKLTQRQTQAMERDIERFSKRAGLILAGAVVAGFAASIKAASDFERAMAEVSTLLDDTSSLDGMTESVKSLAKEFGNSPTEQAKALYQIISAGAEAGAEATEILTAANKLAVGGVTDLKTAADGLTSVLNAYGSQAGSVTDVSDKFFAAMKAGKTTVGELSSAIGPVINVAVQLGVTFDELIAAGATLTTTGLTTSAAFNGLKAVMANIIKPSEQAQKTIARLNKETEGLNLEFSAAAVQSKGFTKFLDEVKAATGGNIETMAQLFGSIEGLDKILALTGSSADKFAETLKSVENSAGETEKAVAKMQDTVDQAFKRLKASVAVELIETGDLEGLAGIINSVADNIDLLSNSLKAVTAILGGVFIAKIALSVTSLKTLIATIGIARFTFATMLGGVGLAAAAVGSVVTAWQRISKILQDANKDIGISTKLLYGQAAALKAVGDAAGLAALRVELATKLADLGKQAIELEGQLIAAREELGQFGGPLMEQIAGRIEGLELALANVGKVFNATRAELRATDQALISSSAAIAGFVDDVLGLKQAFGAASDLSAEEFQKSLDQIIDAAFPLQKLMQDFEANTNILNRALAEGVITNDQYQTALNFLSDALGKASTASDAAAKKFTQNLTSILDAVNPVEALVREFSDQVAVLDKALREGTIGPEQYREALNFLSDTLGEAAKASDRATREFEQGLEAILDGIDPAQKLVRDFEKQIALLTKALKAGRIGPEQYQDAVNELSDALGKAIEATDEFGQALQSVLDEAFPVQAMVTEFQRKLEVLTRALDEGRISQQQYQQALNALSDSLGKAAASAQDTGNKIVTESERMREAVLEATRQMTQAFLGMWSEVLSGGEDAFDGLLDALETSLAQLVHAISTAKIGEELQKALTPGGSINFSNLASGIASAIGIAIGSELGGGGRAASIGASVGAIAGKSLFETLFRNLGSKAGPLGSIIGAIAGGLLGKLFGGKKTVSLQLVGADVVESLGSFGNLRQTIETDLGGVIVTNAQRLSQDAIDEVTQSVSQFDAAIAEFLTSDQINAVTESLRKFGREYVNEQITIQEILGDRFNQILFAFGDGVRNFVDNFATLEQQISALGVAVGAQRILDEAPELFPQRTLEEFLSVVTAMREGSEDLTETFQRVVALLDQIIAVQSFLGDFAISDLAGDFNALLTAQSQTAAQALAGLNAQLMDAVVNFDGSIESFQNIAVLVSNVREGEIAYLTQLDSLQKGLNANLEDLRADILGLTAAPKTAQDLISQAGNLIGQIQQATNAEDVAGLEQQFSSLIRSIEPDDARFRQIDILSLIDRFQAAANQTIEGLRTDALSNADATRELIGDFIVRIGDPLAIIAASNERVATALETLAGGPQSEPFGVSDQTAIVGEFTGEELTVGDVVAANESLAQRQQQIIDEGLDNIALIIDSGNIRLVNEMAAALSSLQIQNVIQLQNSGLVNN